MRMDPSERIANALERIADSLETMKTSVHHASQAEVWMAVRHAAADRERTASNAAARQSYSPPEIVDRAEAARSFRNQLDTAAVQVLAAMLSHKPTP